MKIVLIIYAIIAVIAAIITHHLLLTSWEESMKEAKEAGVYPVEEGDIAIMAFFIMAIFVGVIWPIFLATLIMVLIEDKITKGQDKYDHREL